MELNSGLGHYAIYKIGFCEKIILPFAEWNYIISSFKKIALQVSVKFDFWNPVNNQVLLIFFFFNVKCISRFISRKSPTLAI